MAQGLRAMPVACPFAGLLQSACETSALRGSKASLGVKQSYSFSVRAENSGRTKEQKKFTYPQRGDNQKPSFPWRTSQSEPPYEKRGSDAKRESFYSSRESRDSRFPREDGRDSRVDGPSDGGDRNFNTEVPWDTQRRSYNANRSNDSSDSARDEQGASTNKREGERERAEGSSTTKSNETPRFRGTSRYSRYDNGRNMHRAPWEQGPARAARANARDSRPPLPMGRVLEKVDEDDYGDSAFERDGDFTEDPRFGSEETEGRGEKSAMARIVEKLRNIQNNNTALRPKGEDLSLKSNRSLTENSVFLPRPGQLVFPGLDRRWSSPDHPIPKPAADALNERWELRKDVKFPWDKEADEEEVEQVEKKKRVKPPSMAELTIPEGELKRLRALGLMVRQRLKIGRLGVTPGIVEAVHNGWRTCEIVKVKCDGPPALNMKRTHEDLEKRTGGLVIWRSGSAAVVYRGKDYVPPSVRQVQEREKAERKKLMSLGVDEVEEGEAGEKVEGEEDGVFRESAPVEVSGAEHDQAEIRDEEPTELDIIDDILEGLGPRYADWTGNRPVPVDGDLLLSPDMVLKRPFRLLPYGVKPKLSNFEMTDLRHLARPIPPHFVLGKNRGLAGLAAAIVKLWEKSEIVKIGVKRGVQNTNNERMAEDLKRLTGGTLLARDKEFIVLYRGKDFLPPAVQAALEERDAMARALQEEEERVRMAGRSNAVQLADAPPEPSTVGTLEESLEAKATWETWQNSEEQRKAREVARKAKRTQAAERVERKVNLAAQKKERAENELAKLALKMTPAEAPIDREHISEEERYMFRKLGLRMKAFLLIGRRGVFDGVVENMHLHWKHRELVKIIVKGTIAEVEGTAKMLEIESGGILVGIVTTSKGQAIIVYRGKNYQRPPELRPRHLLTKRQALKRSLEMQRKQSLEKHILNLEKEIKKMQFGLSKMEEEASDGESAETNSRVLSESRDNFGGFDEAEFKAEFEAETEIHEFLEDDNEFPLYKGQKKGVKPDSIFRAEPLTRKERLQLRHEALKLGKAAHFNIGKSNVVAGLAKSIRLYFEKHALVKVGVKGRAKGTPVAEILQQIEDVTGGVLVSTEPSKLIFYRGWPEGEERPDMVTDEPEELSSELRAALLQEEEVKDPNDLSYLTKEEAAMVGVEYIGNSEAQREVSAGDIDREDEDELGIDAWNEEECDSDDDEEEGEDWEDDFESDDIEELESQEGDEVADEFDESKVPSKEDSEKMVLIKSQSEVATHGPQ